MSRPVLICLERQKDVYKRQFLGYFLIVGIGVYFSLNILGNELKPAFRQSAEETLIDTANLLAVLVRDDVLNGSIADGRFQTLSLIHI